VIINNHGKVTFEMDTSEKTSLVVQVPSRIQFSGFQIEANGLLGVFVEGEKELWIVTITVGVGLDLAQEPWLALRALVSCGFQGQTHSGGPTSWALASKRGIPMTPWSQRDQPNFFG
jgi:hypothetical protein